MSTIDTIYGPLDDSLLVQTNGVLDLPTEFRVWTEYRLRDTPEVLMLRKLQFPRVHATDVGRWDVCVECTGSREGGHTPSCNLAALLRAADVRGATVVCRMEGVLFQKSNPFTAPSPGGVAVIDGVEVSVPAGSVVIDAGGKIRVAVESELEKSTGEVDTDNEYTCWVEYRLPGQPTPVHRSAHVVAKKAAELFGALTGAVRGAGGDLCPLS